MTYKGYTITETSEGGWLVVTSTGAIIAVYPTIERAMLVIDFPMLRGGR